MSDTDATAPHWVRSARARSSREFHRCSDDVDCDIDTGPWHRARCTRTNHDEHRGYYGHAPNWFVRDCWTRPDRTAARVAARAAARDYNAHGDTEIEPPTNQHRHGAAWLYY